MYSANDTLVDGESPVVRDRADLRDRTADLARIVRHALKAGAAASPLDRAIRAAAATAVSDSTAGADVDSRADALARRLNVLLARRETPALADPHRETVRD